MRASDLYFDIEDMFCRLFSLCGAERIKKEVFSYVLMKSHFAHLIEIKDYQKAYEETTVDVFKEMLDYPMSLHEEEFTYDDYYWVGKVYFHLQQITNKSFSYIFLKFPFEKLHSMYHLYHEIDISQVEEVYFEEEKKTTILKELIKLRGYSIPFISESTGIPVTTLRKYKKDDLFLYKASFKNIYSLSRFFNVPETMFLETIPEITNL